MSSCACHDDTFADKGCRSQVGDVKQSDLPGIEALGREGKKDGQIMMLKNEGKVEAYSVSFCLLSDPPRRMFTVA